MKKLLLLIIVGGIMFILVGCQNQTNDKGNTLIGYHDELEDKDNTLEVKIVAKVDPTTFSKMPIKMISNLNGQYEKDIQYHWILESKSRPDFFEGFLSPEGEPLEEVINYGEPVELGLFAEVNWIEGSVEELKVKLQIEERDSANIIATDEIVIENHAGVYKINEWSFIE